ncbi:metallophosphoesterase [uncultured Clostridium sp.]|uniref:metallophosphoesterase n=1 Tax=uncultured Clostridium sp. TaxID=59620 RepID=UPI0028F080D5|nr:metallophosphoesterase [uncultured Clostridium sp.]
MKEFCIAHLSDLHIDKNEDPNLALVREGLKEDLVNVAKKNNLNIDLLAITGDIINKGNIKSYEFAQNAILDIMGELGLSKKDLVIVPGNHDIPRDEMKKVILDSLNSEQLNDVNFINNGWKHCKIGFESYTNFANQFMEDNCYSEDGFGIKIVKKNDITVKCLLLNTAWTTIGNEDFRNLSIGRWQLESIRKNLLNHTEEYDLGIAFTHHPLNWLKTDEEDMTKDYLLNKKKLGADVVLHGHIHDAKLKTESTPDGSLVYLVSGIGYPEKEQRESGQPKIEKCRYSIYKFNIEENIIECWCRISNKDGRFKPDTTLYSNCDDNGKYRLPLKQDIMPKDIEKQNLLDNNLELDPVPVTAGWIGRDSELKKLLSDKFSATVISGVGGQGKSALAAEFLRRYAKGENKKFELGIWIDCRELPETIHLKLVELMEVISAGKQSVALYKDEKIEDTIIRFYGYLKEHKILVVFDNIDAYVDIKDQLIIGQLTKVLDMALEKEHRSLVMMTCRIPITDNRANFLPINLNGLIEEDGIKFFQSRFIKLENLDDIDNCKKIISHTKGHPWWMGLIAGQIQVNKITLKQCVEQLNGDSLGKNSKVKDYFENIWAGLSGKINKVCQNIVRHLVESPKPLCENQIKVLMSKESNYKDIQKALGRVRSLGLLEWHEDKNDTLYQVHPLVREFIHGSYSVNKQKPFVCKVLYLFLKPELVNMLFYDRNNFEKQFVERNYSKNLVDSIDTCLNSRNYIEALELMCKSHQLLRNNGFHLELVSLGRRILENIDWEKEQVTIIQSKAMFLANFIDVISLLENKEKMYNYLQRYKQFVASNTLPYGLYLSISSFVLWRVEDYNEALIYLKEYDELNKTVSGLWSYQDFETLKGLLLRDTGHYNDALAVFNNQENSSDKFGNIGRCYQKMGNKEAAINYYKKSLDLLETEDGLLSNYNKGYALFWISEIMYEAEKIYESHIFLYLAEKVWKEFAPGLLSNLKDLENKIKPHTLVIDNIEKESKKVWDDFVNEIDELKIN